MDVPHVHRIILLLRCSPRDRLAAVVSHAGEVAVPRRFPLPPPTAIPLRTARVAEWIIN